MNQTLTHNTVFTLLRVFNTQSRRFAVRHLPALFIMRRLSSYAPLLLLIGIIASVSVVYQLDEDARLRQMRKVELETTHVDRVLSLAVSNTSYELGYIARQIGLRHENLDMIQSFLSTFSDGNPQVVKWSRFLWMDKDNQARADSAQGLFSQPIDMSRRDYIPHVMARPMLMQLGKPVLGASSGIPIIPAAMGVVNHEGQYVGTVVTGIQLGKLGDKINNLLPSGNYSFAILDRKLNTIIAPSGSMLAERLPKLSPMLSDALTSARRTGALSGSTFFQRREPYIVYRISRETPYIIVVAYDPYPAPQQTDGATVSGTP